MDLGELFEPLSNAEKFSVSIAIAGLSVSVFLPIVLFIRANSMAKRRERIIDARARRAATRSRKALDIVGQVAELKTKEHELKLKPRLGCITTGGVDTFMLSIRNYSEKPRTLIRAELLDGNGGVVCSTQGARLGPHSAEPARILCFPPGCVGSAIRQVKLKVEPDGEILIPLRFDEEWSPDW